MAQVQQQPAPSEKRKSVRRPHLRIDMTPMVDLGFLLITFFIFTSTMSETKATNLYIPADGKGTEVGASNALSVLLTGNNSVYYYQGKLEDAMKNNGIIATSYDVQNGLGSVVRNMQQKLGTKNAADLTLLIKPTAQSNYNSLMNALDEVLINNVTRYAIMDPDAAELAAIGNH